MTTDRSELRKFVVGSGISDVLARTPLEAVLKTHATAKLIGSRVGRDGKSTETTFLCDGQHVVVFEIPEEEIP